MDINFSHPLVYVPLFLVGGTFALFYVLGPVLIRSVLTLKARSQVLPVAVGSMPPEVYRYFGETAPAFAGCGFELRAYASMPDQVANVATYVALWANRPAGQIAIAAVSYAAAPGGVDATPTVKAWVEFETKPVPGLEVLTNNSGDIGTFNKRGVKDVVNAADVTDLPTLYGLHLYRESLLVSPDATRYVPDPGRELESLAEGTEFEVRYEGTVGQFRATRGDPDVYRATWPGAFLMTWAQLPPFVQIRAARMRRKAREHLRAAQARPARPPANVRVTSASPYRSALAELRAATAAAA